MGRRIHGGPISSWRYQASWAGPPSAMPLEFSNLSGRHRRDQDRPRHLVRWAAGVTVGALALAGCGVGLSLGRHSSATCADGVRTLRVAVTPELAGVVTKVAATVDSAPGACTKTVVTAASSASVATSLRTSGESARAYDVWIPDSSAWLRRSAVGPLHLATPYPSVARSPIVVAVARQTAAGLGWNGRTVDLNPFLDGDAVGRPADIYLPDPHGSAAAAGALLSLQATAAQRCRRTGGSDCGAARARGERCWGRCGDSSSRCWPVDGRRSCRRASSRCGRTTGPRPGRSRSWRRTRPCTPARSTTRGWSWPGRGRLRRTPYACWLR